jgi:hypothetical protein
MTHVNTAHRGARIAAALAAVIIGVTACASDSKSSSTLAPVPPTKVATIGGDAGQVVAPAGTAAPSGGSTGSGGTPVDTQTSGGLPLPALDNKYLAIDISFGLEVDDMTKGIDGVVALSDRHGGQIYERTINIADDRSSTASFVIKLPPKEVEAAIAELDAIGARRTVSQGTEDVTSQVVDINARLDTAQASLDRVRKLLEAATDLGQVLSLESQLTERETLVEQYQAMKRAIDERVSLATLRIHLSLSPEPVAKTVAPAKHSSSLSIGKSFKSGWHGFVMALAAILIFVGYTAPFLVMAAIAALVLIPITRRRMRAQRNRSVVPPPPPAPVAGPRTSEPDSVGAARNP